MDKDSVGFCSIEDDEFGGFFFEQWGEFVNRVYICVYIREDVKKNASQIYIYTPSRRVRRKLVKDQLAPHTVCSTGTRRNMCIYKCAPHTCTV